MHDRFERDSLIRIEATETDIDLVPVDPTEIILKVEDPTGNVVTYEAPVVIHDGVGRFHVDISVPLDGQWFYRWIASGQGQAAKRGSFTVQPARPE